VWYSLVFKGILTLTIDLKKIGLYNENLKLTSDAQLIVFPRSVKKLDSLDFSLPRRAANDFPILACAANDFSVSHETNSLPGNKMYVARLKKFSLQKSTCSILFGPLLNKYSPGCCEFATRISYLK
jgi:hypothetical protein